MGATPARLEVALDQPIMLGRSCKARFLVTDMGVSKTHVEITTTLSDDGRCRLMAKDTSQNGAGMHGPYWEQAGGRHPSRQGGVA